MPNLRLVLCGGGNPTHTTQSLFTAGLNLTGSSAPRVLYVPTALTTHTAHLRGARLMRTFTRSLGATLEVLHKFGEFPGNLETAECLKRADLVYVEDGDLTRLLATWVENWFCELLRNSAAEGEFVAMGAGVGAGVWFDYCLAPGHTTTAPALVEGLGVLKGAMCPQHNQKWPGTPISRGAVFQRLLADEPTGTYGVGIDETAALVVNGDSVKAINTGAGAVLRIRRADQGNVATVLAPGLSGPIKSDWLLH